MLFDLSAHYGQRLRKLRAMLALDDQCEIHAYELNPNCDTARHLAVLKVPVKVLWQAAWMHDGCIAFVIRDRREFAPPPVSRSSTFDGWEARLSGLTRA